MGNRFLRRHRILFIVVVIFFSLTVLKAQAAAWTVCAASAGFCDFTTITAAINSQSVVDCDTLNTSGTFIEDLNITKSLHIQSNDTLESNISGTIYVDADFVNITRFNISRTSQALSCTPFYPTEICVVADHVLLDHLNISGTGFAGASGDARGDGEVCGSGEAGGDCGGRRSF